MMMMPLIWLCTVFVLLLRSGGVRRALALAGLGLTAVAGLYFAAGEVDIHESYYVYAGTTSSEGPERLVRSLFGSVWTTYQQSGAFGKGIGTASLGGRYVGVANSETWQESGPAKLMVELGFPGLICASLLVVALARGCWEGLRRMPRHNAAQALQAGLMSIAAANAVSFTISHQAYSDLLIMTLTAFLIGSALGQRERLAARVPAARPGLRPWLPPQPAELRR